MSCLLVRTNRVIVIFRTLVVAFALFGFGGSAAFASIVLESATLSTSGYSRLTDSVHPKDPAVNIAAFLAYDQQVTRNLLTASGPIPVQTNSYSTPGTGEISTWYQNTASVFATGTPANVTSFGGSFQSLGAVNFQGDQANAVYTYNLLDLSVNFAVDSTTTVRVDLGWNDSVTPTGDLQSGYAGVTSTLRLFRIAPNYQPGVFEINSYTYQGIAQGAGSLFIGPTNDSLILTLAPGTYLFDIRLSGTANFDPYNYDPRNLYNDGTVSYSSIRSFQITSVPEPSSFVLLGLVTLIAPFLRLRRSPRKSR